MSFEDFLKGCCGTIEKHSNEIGVGVGLGLLAGSIIFAAMGSNKATLALMQKEKLKGAPLTTKEKFLASYKHYIASTALALSGGACIIFSVSDMNKRNAALAAAYSLSEATLNEYKEKVKDEIGEKKEKIIEDKIAEDHIKKNPPQTEDLAVVTDGSRFLHFDDYSKNYFYMSTNELDKVFIRLNYAMLSDTTVTAADYCYALGVPSRDEDQYLEWDANDGDLNYIPSSLLLDDGRVCKVVKPSRAPKPCRRYGC